MKLPPKDREDGRPPRLESMGGSFERCVRGKECSDVSKLRVESGFQGSFCREGRRRRDK